MASRLTTMALTGLISLVWISSGQAVTRIEVNPPKPVAGSPFTLSISGDRSDSCAPGLEHVEQRDGEILILARRTTKGCLKAATHWQINLDQTDLVLDNDQAATVTTVKFLVSDDQDEIARLQAFDLLVTDGIDIHPENGLWWGEAGGKHANGGPGTGYSIESQGNRLVMMANVYDSVGNPQWLFFSSELNHGIARGKLLTLYGGQSLFGDYAPPEAALESGEMIVQFDSPATATAWFLASDSEDPDAGLALKPMSLVRYAFALGPSDSLLSGQWLLIIDSSTRELDFSAMTSNSDFQSSYSEPGGMRLDCTARAGRSQSPPQQCHLAQADGSPFADLEEIGLNRMSGWTLNGQRATLVRWKP